MMADEGWELMKRRQSRPQWGELIPLVIEQDWCDCEVCQAVRKHEAQEVGR